LTERDAKSAEDSSRPGRAAADPSPLLVLDVGNTSITAAFVPDAEPETPVAVRHVELDDAELAGALERILAPLRGEFDIAMSSVAPRTASRVVRALAGRRVAIAPVDFAPAAVNRCVPPQLVGLDRLFAAAGGREDLDFVIVDAGTAITVDRVDRGRVFRGGAILPGMWMGFESLHRRTGQLPLVAPAAEPRALGTSTEDAIRSGVQLGLAGAIERIARELARDDPPGLRREVVVTGGDASWFLPLLASLSPRHDPRLTLRGIAASYRSPEAQGSHGANRQPRGGS
jgi:type III pantothenate kinase